LKHIAGDKVDVYSAGTVVTGVNPFAIRVMREKGIDISGQHSKSFEEFIDKPFDFVISVCDRARQVCPAFPGKYEKIHWSIEDPGTVEGTDDEKLKAFRGIRDLLFGLIRRFVGEKIK